MLLPCILVQSCAHLLSALLRTPRATLKAQINNKVSDKKDRTRLSDVQSGNICEHSQACYKMLICSKLNIAIANTHASKRDI